MEYSVMLSRRVEYMTLMEVFIHIRVNMANCEWSQPVSMMA